MKTFFKLKAIVGVMALAATGSAFANTSIADGSGGNGSVFLNVVDQTNSTSFVFDTGLHLNSFTGAASTSYDLSSDANWQTFVTGAGSDALQYNVVAENSSAGTNVYNVDFTSNAALGTGVGKIGSTTNDTLSTVSALNPFIGAINASTSPTTNSLYVTDTGANANDPAYFGSSFSLGTGFQTLTSTSGIKNLYGIGTTVKFYQLGFSNGDAVGSDKALVTTFAGTWNLTGNLLSYTVPVQTVPLPKSWALLLSGLVLMGVIARRGKTAEGDSFSGFAA